MDVHVNFRHLDERERRRDERGMSTITKGSNLGGRRIKRDEVSVLWAGLFGLEDVGMVIMGKDYSPMSGAFRNTCTLLWTTNATQVQRLEHSAS